MNYIKERRIELQTILGNTSGCYTTDNISGFTLKSKTGVTWSKTGKKWGQAFEEDLRFHIAIDFPEGSYQLKELTELIGLKEREEGAQVSGILLRRDKPFDSVRISIYKDKLNTYTFRNETFIRFINEVALKVIK